MGGVVRTNPLLSQTNGAQELVRAVSTGAPYAAGKLGTSEFDALCWYVTNRKHKSHPQAYPLHIFRHMVINAGLFPNSPATIDQWSEHMLNHVLPVMDLMIEWNPALKLQEYYFLESYSPQSKRTVLRALEPYYEPNFNDRYTLAIPAGEKVAIVSPFADSILEQCSKLNTIWTTPVLSTNTFIPVQAFFNPLTGSEKYQWHNPNWLAACESIVEKVKSVNAKYVLIGCGALSLPIAAALKQAGCIAIHTGGATQILFGIKGKRWDTHDAISKLYNSAWVRPSPHEVPEHGAAIENGCYF